MKWCMAKPDVPEKIFLPQKLGKWAKKGQKEDFLNISENFVINFY